MSVHRGRKISFTIRSGIYRSSHVVIRPWNDQLQSSLPVIWSYVAVVTCASPTSFNYHALGMTLTHLMSVSGFHAYG